MAFQPCENLDTIVVYYLKRGTSPGIILLPLRMFSLHICSLYQGLYELPNCSKEKDVFYAEKFESSFTDFLVN